MSVPGFPELTPALMRAATPFSNPLFAQAAAAAGIGLWCCKIEDETLTWTDGVYDLFQLARGSAVTRPMATALYREESRREMTRLRSASLRTKKPFSLDAQIRTGQGQDRWMRLSAHVACEGTRPTYLFGLKQDVTRERLEIDRLRALAETDPLTGLANRSGFEAALERARRDARFTPAALALMDVDDFKAVNDSFGHLAGDQCLIRIAEHLRGATMPGGIAARLGGDEFALLIPGGVSRREIAELLRTLVTAVGQPIPWNGRTIAASCSAGVATVEGDAVWTPRDLLGRADQALYGVKYSGGNGFRFAPKAPSPEREAERLPCV